MAITLIPSNLSIPIISKTRTYDTSDPRNKDRVQQFKLPSGFQDDVLRDGLALLTMGLAVLAMFTRSTATIWLSLTLTISSFLNGNAAASSLAFVFTALVSLYLPILTGIN